nr:MAG TPA: hypothetical protein [Caudoviricetes sp.]
MINFEYIKRFFIGDGRFRYVHNLCTNEMLVELQNGQKFTITQEKKVFKIVYILPYGIKVSFIIYDEDDFKNSIETIYKSATISDDQPEETEEVEPTVSIEDIKLVLDSYGYTFKDFTTVEGDIVILVQYRSDIKICISKDKDKWVFECECKYRYRTENKTFEADSMVEINRILSKYKSISDFNYEDAIKYPIGGNTMPNQTVNKSFDFLNDYKVVKLAERAINDNFAELAELFFNYSNSEEELETILWCGNSKVLFFAHGSNRKITIEFGQDGEEPFRYVHTNNGINMLNDYDPKALITIGNLIESAVDAWLEDDENRMNSIGLNDHMLSLVDNIKTMINLINTTIGKYNA